MGTLTTRNPPPALFLMLGPVLILLLGGGTQPIANGGFESIAPAESWQIDGSDPKGFTLATDKVDVKEGNQSLLLTADRPTDLSLHQELFLPVGTLWHLTGWTKFTNGADSNSAPTPRIGIQTPIGDQGFSHILTVPGEWQRQSVVFRVPSPGRITVTLNAFDRQAGRVWFDDIRLERFTEDPEQQSVTISNARLSNRPIDIKQGGQFIEPLCNLLPSMVAQQVESTSFEEETAWNQAYKREIDRPYRPWYPDGSVHVAKYSTDTDHPFNGLRSEKIELPVSNTWAGISQDGYYIEAGHSYRLRLHLRSDSGVHVRAFLHGEGGVVAGPVSLGSGTKEWRGSDGLFVAKRNISNATLTIEFEGPGILWLDRIYLIDANAVLGLWRPDVVNALKAMKPGIVRFGGSTIETFDWSRTLGDWDSRTPFSDDPWGGLQENFVGVEEFVKLVQYIGAEPLICVRWTGKTPEDAADEVEYFNGSLDSKWGRLRSRNGHPEPYRIKYWQIGNEVSGPDYDASLQAFGQAMRRVDPSIKLLSSFPSPDTLRLAAGQINYLSPHHYSVGDLDGTEGDFKRLREEIARDAKGVDVRVAVTEWNTTGGEFGITRGTLLTLGNALGLSRYQNILHRYSDLVEIANRSNLSDSFGSGAIQPSPGSLYFTPAYFSQRLYQRAAGSFSLRIDRNSKLPFYLNEPDLDATLTANGETLRIYAVNSTGQPRRVRFSLAPQLGAIAAGTAFILGDQTSNADSEAMNSRDEPDRVAVTKRTFHVAGSVTNWDFAPFSLTLLELELTSKDRAVDK